MALAPMPTIDHHIFCEEGPWQSLTFVLGSKCNIGDDLGPKERFYGEYGKVKGDDVRHGGGRVEAAFLPREIYIDTAIGGKLCGETIQSIDQGRSMFAMPGSSTV